MQRVCVQPQVRRDRLDGHVARHRTVDARVLDAAGRRSTPRTTRREADSTRYVAGLAGRPHQDAPHRTEVVHLEDQLRSPAR